MDLNEIWQAHKKFLLGVLGAFVLFTVTNCTLIGGQEDEALRQRSAILRATSSVTTGTPKPKTPGSRRGPSAGLYSGDTGMALRREADRERRNFRAMAAALHFEQRVRWPYRNDVGFTVPDGTPQPSFLCSTAAAALDAFWRAELATRWTGRKFEEHFQRYPKETSEGEKVSRPERFLIAMDLADRVLQLAAHHRLSGVEIKTLDRASAASRSRNSDGEELLAAEVPVEFALRGPSLHMRLFLQDALGNTDDDLLRNAEGDDRVAIQSSVPSGVAALFARQGSPWPLQPEVPTSLTLEPAADGESNEVVLQITFVARVLADPRAAAPEDESEEDR